MLTWFRDNAKIFLIITIVIFVSLIFLRWGMGKNGAPPKNPYQRPIAMVNGKKIMPDDYNRALQFLNNSYRNMLENMNNPDPEAMLILMADTLTEEAFRKLINEELKDEYLKKHGWDYLTLRQAEALLMVQIEMQSQGEADAEEYLETIKSEEPMVFNQYLYQALESVNSSIFPAAVSMVNMVSLDEVRYLESETRTVILARYILVDSMPPVPGEEYLRRYYAEKTEVFTRPSGSLLRYVTMQVRPSEEDYRAALDRIDSLAYASPGTPFVSTRSQLETVFGDSLNLEKGRRTDPVLGFFSGNPSIDAYHVFLLDSTKTFRSDSITLADALRDTLFIKAWETPVLPGYNTIRRAMWDLESSMETLLESPVPNIPDTMNIIDFGEVEVIGRTPSTSWMPDEMLVFASDTTWNDPLGPVFYIPSYNGGYPAFAVVRRIEFFGADTLDYEEASESGMLLASAYKELRSEASTAKAEKIMRRLENSGMSLTEFAEAESLQANDTGQFTAAEIWMNSISDGEIPYDLLSSGDFALAVLSAPEFSPIGPFPTLRGSAIAEIISRTFPPDEPERQIPSYISTQYGHQLLVESKLLEMLGEAAEIQDLREEWSEYLESVEDSLRTEQEEAGKQ